MNCRNIPITALILFTLSLIITPKIFSDPTGTINIRLDSAITIDSIKNELSADGEWIKVNPSQIDSESVTDGTKEFDNELNTDYVWRPNNVDENWSPYTNGYWTYTNCGWMWVSNYDWGWRPYHYGRWWWSPIWGWVWSPGYVWAPAWVVWMYWDNYWGWYPLSPRVCWHNRHHHHGYDYGHHRFRVKHWNFVEKHNFLKLIDDGGMVPKEKNADILKQAKFDPGIELNNGTVTTKGPEVKEVETSTGQKIAAEEVTQYNTSKKVNEIIEKGKKEYQEEEKKITQEKKYNPGNETKQGEVKTEKKTYEPKEETKEKYYEPEQKREPEKQNQPEQRREPEKQNQPEQKNENKQPNNETKGNNNNEKPKDVNKPVDTKGQN